VLRGKEVFKDGQLTGDPGCGRNLFA
jgi:hypothetical protein